jgi:hypothetical protein
MAISVLRNVAWCAPSQLRTRALSLLAEINDGRCATTPIGELIFGLAGPG